MTILHLQFIHPSIHLSIHPSYMSHNRSTNSSKVSLPQSVISCFFFQLTVPFCFRKSIQEMLTSNSSSSHHLCNSFYLFSFMWFRRLFLCMMWQIYIAFFFTICRVFLSSLTSILHSSHSQSKWSSPALCSTTFTVFLISLPKCPCFNTTQSYTSHLALYLQYV